MAVFKKRPQRKTVDFISVVSVDGDLGVAAGAPLYAP